MRDYPDKGGKVILAVISTTVPRIMPAIIVSESLANSERNGINSDDDYQGDTCGEAEDAAGNKTLGYVESVTSGDIEGGLGSDLMATLKRTLMTTLSV